ncbi:MAG: hypothetical protein IH627_17755 [Rubrivivax sp.]|nr:hypothetical protein [Rubrivivax sp.]
MSYHNLLSELWAFADTKEYREGLFVETSGLVLDILLLIIGVKVIAYYLARQSRSTTSFASSFFIAQYLREVLVLQMKTGGVIDTDAAVKDAFEARKLKSMFSHFYYGNIENIFDLLRIRMRSGEHIAGHRALAPAGRREVAAEAKRLLERLDNLLVILASLRQEEQCLRAYEFRLVLTSVSDYLEYLSRSSTAPPPRTYAPMSTALALTLESWFSGCQKVLDSHYRGKIRWSYARLLLFLPWVLSYRFVVRRWQRLRGRPYTDPFTSNFPAVFCTALEQTLGQPWNEAITASGVKKRDVENMISQHIALMQEQCISTLERVRPFVPAEIWNRVLASSLLLDVDSDQISIVTVDAAKANALYYLTRLAAKDDDTSHLVEETFQSLWNLRPTSR